MPRKSFYDKMADDVSKALSKPMPTIEQQLERDRRISNILGTDPTTKEDYSMGECGHVLWHGVCYVCE